eukprot:1062875-Amphidinium_carterae.1
MDEHDMLLLGIFLPWGAEVWEYNRNAAVGLARQGRATAVHGRKIQLYAPSGVCDPAEAWERGLLARVDLAARRLASIPWSHEVWTRSNITRLNPAESAYRNVQDPFRLMNGSTRGLCLTEFCRWYGASVLQRFVGDALPENGVD